MFILLYTKSHRAAVLLQDQKNSLLWMNQNMFHNQFLFCAGSVELFIHRFDRASEKLDCEIFLHVYYMIIVRTNFFNRKHSNEWIRRTQIMGFKYSCCLIIIINENNRFYCLWWRLLSWFILMVIDVCVFFVKLLFITYF